MPQADCFEKPISPLLSSGTFLGGLKKQGSQMMTEIPPRLTQRLTVLIVLIGPRRGHERKKTQVTQANRKRMFGESDSSI